MNVEPSIQSKLLDLAAVDAELTRIEHRRKVLPEQQEVQRLEAERSTRKDAAVKVEILIDDLDRDIRKLETEVDSVRKREQRDRGMLESGSVGAKQLSELQHELTSLERRRTVLEDDMLDVMERREAAVADHQHAGANLSKAEEDLADARRRRDRRWPTSRSRPDAAPPTANDCSPPSPRNCSASTTSNAPSTASAPRCCRLGAAAPAASNSTAARSPGSPRPTRRSWSAAPSAARSWCAPSNPGCKRSDFGTGVRRASPHAVGADQVEGVRW